MNKDHSESPGEGRIDHEAAEWCAKGIRGFTAEEQDAFFEWLAIDAKHSEWYARHQKTWRNLDLLAQWIPEHSDKPNMDLLKSKQRGKPWNLLKVVAAALVVFGFAYFIVERSSTAFVGVSENLIADAYKSHKLPDGSMVELNRGAALQVKYTSKMRHVELVSSEAHFDVIKDASRPFVVSVRGIEVRAIGTAFNVRLDGDTVQVLVTEGRVQVDSEESKVGEDLETADSFDEPYSDELVAGQMNELVLKDVGLSSSVRNLSMIEMNRRLAWKPQMFVFEATPLSEVVAEFNSRNQGHIVIADSELEDIPIIASFRSANIDHFVDLLELSIGLRVEREVDGRVVLYKKD